MRVTLSESTAAEVRRIAEIEQRKPGDMTEREPGEVVQFPRVQGR